MPEKITSKEKVEFLLIEKDIVRKELLQNLKILFSSLYSFLGVFAVLFVFYYNKDNSDDTLTRSYVLFIIQQIEFVVLLFNIYLNSMVMALAGYCAALEERINFFSDEKISIWESVIINGLVEKSQAVQSLSIFMLNLIYLFVMLYLEVIIQQKEYYIKKEYNLTFLIVGSVEMILLIMMAYFVYRQKEKSYRLAQETLKNA